MVNLIMHRVRLGREGRQWLREHRLRARPFKRSLAAFLKMDQRSVEVRVRHCWAEDVIRRVDAERPVLIDYALLPTMVPLNLIRDAMHA